MIATAIGPQKIWRDRGIIASTAAAAVSMIGRKRRTAEPTIASHVLLPACSSCSIWSTRITELRRIMPISAMTPRLATKPKGLPKAISASATPISPSGAVSSTITVRRMLCSCIISRVITATTISGITALSACSFFADSSIVPPMSTL